ncbi:MAG: relaxase domain-containing protein, partial [Gammaproteobacteria bacterium]|nr:relaxase domain-containing protein [Gammaproteobacteria bacterium]
MDNIRPDNGESITAHQRSNRTAGYDFTFNAPKSLSILYEHSKDDNLLSAFRESVHETMQEIEQKMEARVRKKGADYNCTTGNLAYAEFIHHTARPVDGIPDPHLHAHCFVMNATLDTSVFDGKEQQWKAGQFQNIKADAPYYEAAFHARLSQKIHNLGYDIETKGKFWDIAGVNQDIIDKYSHRTAQIEQVAQDNNITNAKTKSELAATTRESKTKGLTREDLSEIWDARLSNEERFTLNHLKQADGEGDNLSRAPRTNANLTLDFAINHLLERQSVAKLSNIKEQALRAGYGA